MQMTNAPPVEELTIRGLVRIIQRQVHREMAKELTPDQAKEWDVILRHVRGLNLALDRLDRTR